MQETKNTEQPFKSGFISIIGRPNVGKSTLLNSIMGEKLVITANKPQTTRNAIRCIHTDADSQMVFIDTPGMHKPKNKLGAFMLKSAEDTISDVDVVLFLVEPEDRIGPGDQYILDKLAGSRTPVLLIINKIDTVPKEELLKTLRPIRITPSWTVLSLFRPGTVMGYRSFWQPLKSIWSRAPCTFRRIWWWTSPNALSWAS